jgi:hypothetical protein
MAHGQQVRTWRHALHTIAFKHKLLEEVGAQVCTIPFQSDVSPTGHLIPENAAGEAFARAYGFSPPISSENASGPDIVGSEFAGSGTVDADAIDPDRVPEMAYEIPDTDKEPLAVRVVQPVRHVHRSRDQMVDG